MCGRYTLVKTKKSVEEHYSSKAPSDQFKNRYNIAPSQNNLVVTQEMSERKIGYMSWGFPSPESPASYRRIINGRAESIAHKKSFKNSFRSKRCLIPADGFIEWKSIQGAKYPYHISMKSGDIFSFAGLWAEFKQNENTIQSYCIITTEANTLLKQIHHRMPVIMPERHYESWLSNESDKDALISLLQPFPEERMTFRPVSKCINSIKNDSPECLEPGDLPPLQQSLF